MRQILLYLFILMACGVNAEQFRITGTVVDAGDNEPLIGVGVQIKGTDRGTATDFDGNFCIDVEKGAILNFSYIGYDSKEVEVLNDSSLIIELVRKGEIDIENSVGIKHCFTPPILSLDSFDFSLPKSELKKLQQYDESLRGKFFQLDEYQIGRAKYLICEEIGKTKSRLISLMLFGQYARQYLGVKHNGHRMVFINLVPSSLIPQFKDRLSDSLITVDDGGDEFVRAIVDLTDGEVMMLRMNGE